jgi:DNA polymerase-2
LPELIAGYAGERQIALDRGDDTAAFVYKILMNSFYGVLGSAGCRYGRTELAGAITGFGRLWLEFSRDYFREAGYRVLYGDTDSVFVSMPDTGTAEAAVLGKELADGLNRRIAAEILGRWGLRSWLAIRCEKVYARFLIPRMRGAHGAVSEDRETERGRAKGYAGLLWVPGGAGTVEVKGMEAVRSDWTALARRFQTALLDKVFRDIPDAAMRDWAADLANQLRTGQLDGELVYRKSLRRPAREYGHAETPQVRAARLLGWTDRRGTVEYLMTIAGAEPLGAVVHPIDYRNYLEHQLVPIWHSICEVAGIEAGHPFDAQYDLPF